MITKTIHDPAYRAMIRRLRERRLELGLSQEDVARQLKVPRMWTSKVEQCERRLDFLETLDQCRLYGIDPAELAKIIEKRP